MYKRLAAAFPKNRTDFLASSRRPKSRQTLFYRDDESPFRRLFRQRIIKCPSLRSLFLSLSPFPLSLSLFLWYIVMSRISGGESEYIGCSYHLWFVRFSVRDDHTKERERGSEKGGRERKRRRIALSAFLDERRPLVRARLGEASERKIIIRRRLGPKALTRHRSNEAN